jgi:lysophospholipase L1-like esterase
MRRPAIAALALAAVCLQACGGPTGPTPSPTPASPQISCANPIVIEGITTETHAVTYPPPTTSGGSSPVSVACAPESGSQFSIGVTTVTCNASDAVGRQASCSFAVTLRHRPFALTRYLAFGDSITLGENGRPLGLFPVVDWANAYPTLLQRTFLERVPDQPIVVENAGLGGERVTESGIRLREEIEETQAEVLLLLEGINDLNRRVDPREVVSALSDRIHDALDRGVQYIFVSTLLPVAPDNCGPPPPNCRGRLTSNTTIAETNSRIRAMVPAEGGYLVDPFDRFMSNSKAYIDTDGLHPTPEGNRALAEAFWARILQVIPAARLFGS